MSVGPDRDTVLELVRSIAREITLGSAHSGHWGHKGVKGQRGGSAPSYQIGITSHRPVGERPFQPQDLDEFKTEMGKTPVERFSSYLGRGGWQNGWEPTFVTQYRGNGEAIKTIARFAKKYRQDGALIQRYTNKEDAEAQPQIRITFNGRVTKSQRAEIEKNMGEVGIPGWTWARQGGKRVLMMTCVPQWGGEKSAHIRSCGILKSILRNKGYSVRSLTRQVYVTTMDGSNYDQFISGDMTATGR